MCSQHKAATTQVIITSILSNVEYAHTYIGVVIQYFITHVITCIVTTQSCNIMVKSLHAG